MAHKVSTMELDAAHALLQLQSSPRVDAAEEATLSDDCAPAAEDPLPNAMEVDAAHALLQLQSPDAAGETDDKESVTGNPVTIDQHTGIPPGYTLVITSDYSESEHSGFDDDDTDSDDSVMECCIIYV